MFCNNVNFYTGFIDMGKSDNNRKRKRYTMTILEEVKDEFQQECFANNISMSVAVEQLMKNYTMLSKEQNKELIKKAQV